MKGVAVAMLLVGCLGAAEIELLGSGLPRLRTLTIYGGVSTNRQIEACRIAINRFLKRKGKVWIRIFPDKPITKKPAEVRMGKGKGDVEGYVAVVKPGRVMFEVGGVPEDVAREALRKAAQKLPVLTKIIEKQ